ncbi:DUF1488 family protein [Oricola thermophila]|uniref:DUF1488 family protein n=1 Tax=Oricola thermophila TaxID=2742145 RepID=A0A6N1VDY4_9HYPH|nr:DUF1488 family protein [Oricola thermophila]QKV17369.1 DUF1488 family protein [Oricola thermophila]
MTLTFLNESRFYDPGRRQIRFVGHDGMSTVPFRIDIDAIVKKAPDMPGDESLFLNSFDGKRESIRSVAREAYSNRRQTVYVLTAEDFR